MADEPATPTTPIAPKPPELIPRPQPEGGAYEMVSFDVVNNHGVLVIRTASGALFTGRVVNWVQLSRPK